MRKRIAVILIVLIALVSLSACGETVGSGEPESKGTDSSEQVGTVTENDTKNTMPESEGEEEDVTDVTSEQSVVYFTSDISAQGLVNIYRALGWEPAGKVAVKISTGEPPASNYLIPELIGNLVQMLDGTIVECNTAYGGSRSSAAIDAHHASLMMETIVALREKHDLHMTVERYASIDDNAEDERFIWK